MKKTNYTFYLHPEVSEQIDAHLVTTGRGSRSAFVEDAIAFYCGALDAETNRAFLGDEVIKTMRAIVQDLEGRIFSHFRSQDISLSMLAILFAANLTGMTDEEIALMRRSAVRYVDENHRAKSFVLAIRDERGGA